MSLYDELVVPVTGRPAEMILELHGLSFQQFAGKVVLDLGCGNSDLGYDLAAKGINARVIGFDFEKSEKNSFIQTSTSTKRRVADITRELPVPPKSADIVLATYSLPFWGRTGEEIDGFFESAKNATKVGGILSIYPLDVTGFSFDPDNDLSERHERVSALRHAIYGVEYSPDWQRTEQDPGALTAIRLA